ncbi:hypothetical protein OnM2_02946 [Erysiphe neolycopersici]|uniref:Secreted protein n=1 Tax=Erysiphe neolycopersici TaxID=212602 RepID=A0A420I461_9PEZI|nr:hypothetical protein OnM2_02946 [Erysiphe neolycopersici]
MKFIVLMTFFTAATAFEFLSDWNFFSDPPPHEYAICVNTIQMGGSYTYNDAATLAACNRYKEDHKCADCEIITTRSDDKNKKNLHFHPLTHIGKNGFLSLE